MFIRRADNFIAAVVLCKQSLIGATTEQIVTDIYGRPVQSPRVPPEVQLWIKFNQMSSEVLRNLNVTSGPAPRAKSVPAVEPRKRKSTPIQEDEEEDSQEKGKSKGNMRAKQRAPASVTPKSSKMDNFQDSTERLQDRTKLQQRAPTAPTAPTTSSSKNDNFHDSFEELS